MVTVTRSHHFLEYENLVNSNGVKRGRTDKVCEHCKKDIPIGMEHRVHTFIPGYDSYPTHLDCSLSFVASLR